MAARQEEFPAVARQRVRRALRRARQATPMSQGAVASRLGWSLSKMQRIEGGEVGVSVTDLRALLDVYGVVEPERIERLAEDARISRRQRWVTAPEYREHLTPGLREDRKSTRLNSSHVKNSYAVFCLKKKKNDVERLEDSQDEPLLLAQQA